MHKFIDNIVAFSLKNKFFIFFCTIIAIIIGVISFKHTPIDAFPDVTNTKVTIITQWPGRSAEEVEKFITIPIEIAMNPVQKKTDIRSTTLLDYRSSILYLKIMWMISLQGNKFIIYLMTLIFQKE